MTTARGYAFFDLDYTLIPHDTLLLFCNYVLQKERGRMLFVLLFAPMVPLAVLRVIGSATLKRVFLSFLWRLPADRLDAYARDFVATRVAPEIYPEMRARLDEHKRRGDTVILNTASPEFYVRYIAAYLGVDHAVATRLALHDRQPLIPAYVGRNNKRMEKIDRMRALLPDPTRAWLAAHPDAHPDDPEYGRQAVPGARAYSDSPADLPMLFLSESAVVVHPGKKLRLLAEKRGWQIVTPDRGYRSGFVRYIHSLKQLFGLYRTRGLAR